MIALRYVYVLALSVWFGGTIIIGMVANPVSAEVLQRFFLVSYGAGGLLLVSLVAMALLGPRPSGFAARLGVAVLIFGVTLYEGRELHTLSRVWTALAATGGLVLLFWEARDGTRAA